jgi:periplasmic protein TonB
MEIRHNIFISIMVHAMIIASVFIILDRIRDTVTRVPINLMAVSLFEETADNRTASPSPPQARTERVTNIKSALPQPSPVNDKQRLFHDESGKNEKIAVEHTGGPFAVTGNGPPGLSETINIRQGDKITDRPNLSLPHSKERIGVPGKNILSQGTDDPYALIRTAIERAKLYPLLARKKRIEGTTVIGFAINGNGYPQEIRTQKSSGYEILDSAALNILTKAAPFPKVNGEIIVPITFKLTESSSSN